MQALMIVLLLLVATGFCLATAYIWRLMQFFNELRHKEPDVWQKIGAPTWFNVFFLPFIRFHKFYAFYPILKARRNSDYQYANKAYHLLNVGLLYFLLVFVIVLVIVMFMQ